MAELWMVGYLLVIGVRSSGISPEVAESSSSKELVA